MAHILFCNEKQNKTKRRKTDREIKVDGKKPKPFLGNFSPRFIFVCLYVMHVLIFVLFVERTNFYSLIFWVEKCICLWVKCLTENVLNHKKSGIFQVSFFLDWIRFLLGWHLSWKKREFRNSITNRQKLNWHTTSHLCHFFSGDPKWSVSCS